MHFIIIYKIILCNISAPAAYLGHCLHDDCKLSFPANVPMKRTWMLDVSHIIYIHFGIMH